VEGVRVSIEKFLPRKMNCPRSAVFCWLMLFSGLISLIIDGKIWILLMIFN
jgi:hypothetical protein